MTYKDRLTKPKSTMNIVEPTYINPFNKIFDASNKNFKQFRIKIFEDMSKTKINTIIRFGENYESLFPVKIKATTLLKHLIPEKLMDIFEIAIKLTLNESNDKNLFKTDFFSDINYIKLMTDLDLPQEFYFALTFYVWNVATTRRMSYNKFADKFVSTPVARKIFLREIINPTYKKYASIISPQSEIRFTRFAHFFKAYQPTQHFIVSDQFKIVETKLKYKNSFLNLDSAIRWFQSSEMNKLKFYNNFQTFIVWAILTQQIAMSTNEKVSNLVEKK